MNYRDIWESITEINPDAINAAEKTAEIRKNKRRKRLTALAACVAIALILCGWQIFFRTSPSGGGRTNTFGVAETTGVYAAAEAEGKLSQSRIELISFAEPQYTIVEGKVISKDEPMLVMINHVYKTGRSNLPNPLKVSLGNLIDDEGEKPEFALGGVYCFFLEDMGGFWSLWSHTEKTSLTSTALLSEFLVRQMNFNAALMGKSIEFSTEFSLKEALDALYGR